MPTWPPNFARELRILEEEFRTLMLVIIAVVVVNKSLMKQTVRG
jgi:hypothetical protein